LANVPAWLALFAPVPDDAVIERKPVASRELIASGQVDAIAGWSSITVNLSDIAIGMRHVQITLDADDRLLSASDTVMFERREQRGNTVVIIYDHENVGGRFEEDGSFRGTRWVMRTEQIGDDHEHAHTTSLPSPPSPSDVTSLRALVDAVLTRAPARPSPADE
jgi:hypothetical protein